MAEGTYIKDLKQIDDASDSCDLIIEDETPTTMRIKLGDLKTYITQEVNTQVTNALSRISTNETAITTINNNINSINNDLSDLNQANAYAHNAIYRGKSLGSSVTSEQYSAISSGTFDDLYIGDYWTINSVNWRIAGFNYYYNCGSSYNFTTNHIVIVPDTNLYSAQMNDSNTTTGGYVGSQMYTTNIADAKSTINSAFGSSHIATHELYLTTGVTSGYPSAGAWSDETVVLMNEEMVYGCPIRQQMCAAGSSVQNHTVEKSQLPLFRYAPRYQNIRANYWLRDIVTASSFADVTSNGNANSGNASDSYGVRPAFCLIS